eukprot:5327481-Pleurochrysis_carterae.AAC.1
MGSTGSEILCFADCGDARPSVGLPFNSAGYRWLGPIVVPPHSFVTGRQRTASTKSFASCDPSLSSDFEELTTTVSCCALLLIDILVPACASVLSTIGVVAADPVAALPTMASARSRTPSIAPTKLQNTVCCVNRRSNCKKSTTVLNKHQHYPKTKL